MDKYKDYGITAAQYHAGLDKLWDALGPDVIVGEDVFTLAAGSIRQHLALRAAVREENDAFGYFMALPNSGAARRALMDKRMKMLAAAGIETQEEKR